MWLVEKQDVERYDVDPPLEEFQDEEDLQDEPKYLNVDEECLENLGVKLALQ
jgi:hypothetical protein